MTRWMLLCALGLPLAAQAELMNARDALTLAERMVQLAESTSVTAPGLARAAAPMLENLHQDDKAIKIAGRLTIGTTYAILADSRAYLALADGLPKPFPPNPTAKQQFTELRDAIERLEIHFRAVLQVTEAQLRGADRDNLRRYSEANKTLLAATPDRVVFLGDSITDGWRLNEYFPGKDFVNRGISGQITGEMLGRMQADVIANKPAAMVVLAGTNDIARGVSVETIQNNLKMIADLAEKHSIKVILASILPTSDHHKDRNPRFEMTRGRPLSVIRELNQYIVSMCKKRGFTYLDYYDATVDSSGQLKADLADDGLHPNADGYRIMAPLAQAAIEKTLAESRIPQQTGKKKRP
ncbi:MAG: GDSL-type esterase/lipase family protein [Bryobacteraceae bacterium]